jgi:hypothetical protein
MTTWDGDVDRLSIGYFPGGQRDDADLRLQGRAFLFVRDLPLGVMPYRTSGKSDFVATLAPDDEGTSQWLMELLDMRGHRHWDLEDAVSDFVREVVGALAYSGELHFEIVPTAEEPGEGPQLPRVRLLLFPPGRVIKAGRRYLQLVPKYARQEVGKRYVSIPAARVWRLQLPRSLGSPRRHRRMLRRLALASDVVPSFAHGPTLGSDVIGYDLGAYRLAKDAEVENLTKLWGSIPSLQRIEGTTEFYLFARTLQFRRSVAALREKVVDDINALIKRLGSASRLEIKGLPTSERIEELMDQLQDGTIDFKQALEDSRTP